MNPITRLFQRSSVPIMNRITQVVHMPASDLHIRKANTWRDNYNPLRGLTMRRVVSLMEEGERGAYADLQWTYRFLEKRDATLRGGKRSLISSVVEMDWDIRQIDPKKLPAGYTVAQAKRQARTLRGAYERLDNIRAAIGHLALAEFRSYGHLEKHRDSSGLITHLEPVGQWYFCRDGLKGEWKYNATADSGKTDGIPLNLSNWIIREVGDPIDEIALIAFVRKNLSQKDWDGFIESYGIPSIFAIMPQDVPAGKESEYQTLAEKVVSNSRGALPSGSDIKSVNNADRRANPFREHLRYQDEQIVMTITSGMLTMLAESGGGSLAGGAHSETFGRISRALAKRISETFQAQFDKEILNQFHPGEAVLAYFEIAANEEQDSGKVVEHVLTLAGAGLDVDPAQIEEKTGYRVRRITDRDGSPQPQLIQNRHPTEPDEGIGRIQRQTRSLIPVVGNFSLTAHISSRAAVSEELDSPEKRERPDKKTNSLGKPN